MGELVPAPELLASTSIPIWRGPALGLKPPLSHGPDWVLAIRLSSRLLPLAPVKVQDEGVHPGLSFFFLPAVGLGSEIHIPGNRINIMKMFSAFNATLLI